MRGTNKKNYLLIFAIIDLLALLATFILTKYIFVILLLLNIMLITIVIPVLYFQLLTKGMITPKEYYMSIVEKEYQYLDNNLLTLMFELRIENLRKFYIFISCFFAGIHFDNCV